MSENDAGLKISGSKNLHNTRVDPKQTNLPNLAVQPMTGRTEFAGRNERVHHVLRRLIDDVRVQRGLERITIVTPTNQASFYIRRSLAKEGLFNVDFKRLEDVAEHLAGRDFKQRLLHDLQASEFVFEAARDVTLGSKLGGESVSPQLQTALHSTFRELELLDRAQLDQLAAEGDVLRELVLRFDKYMKLAEPYRRGSLVAQRAAKNIVTGKSENLLNALGTVLLVEASVVAPVQRPLFDALAGMPNTVTVTIVDSPPEIDLPDHPVEESHRLSPIGVPDVAEEVRAVVREVVNQARSGKTFARMAVVFEDDSYSSRIAEALELAEIPVSGPDRTALSDAPEGQFVTGLLDIFHNDFSRLDLTAWLSSAPVKDPSSGKVVPAARWDAISRSAGVTSSVQDSWIPRLDRFAKNVVRHAERSSRLDEGRANEVDAARSDAEYAVWLKKFVVTLAERVPTDAENSWSGFGKWLRSMVEDFLMPEDPDSTRSQSTRLLTLIDRLESLETDGPLPMFEHCAGVLREQLSKRSAGLRSLGAGVYVGPVWTAAGCPFDTVFVVGMSEGRYPSPGFTDPLLPDPLKKEIDPAGLSLGTVERRVTESHQAFVSVLENAEQVFMYWPSGIPGESREFGPARWFLSAVREVSGLPLLQAGKLLEGGIPGLTIHRRSDSMHLPLSKAGDAHEYDVIGARSWNINGNTPESFPLATEVASILDSVKFESAQEGPVWTEYDGKLDLSVTGASSGISETVGSATAFETYAACPYRYFLSRRLHIEPTESPEPELALDALTFGTLIHDVLEKFALWRMESKSDVPSRVDQEKWLRSSTTEHVEKLKEDTPGRSEGAWKIELSRAWLILRQWLRREPDTADQPDMRQVEAEYSFGSDRPNSNSGPAVEVRTASGKTVKFRGQVDRVDISEDGSRVIVYDYKSGGNSSYSKLDSDPVKKGTKLQLPLYSKAVANKYPDADIFASYWFVRENASELKPAPSDYDSAKAETALTSAVETIVEGIEAGIYPARPGDSASWGESNESFENCMFCEYARVCPKSKARLWNSKKESDPALVNYLNLAEDRE
ncbi:MAG: PD-(D/E)XK nuclease family protein [Chloroflexi bacterium]|nr:PD-(D/E)XK nuclease family protein [Chloroflexota bacterium]